MMMTTMMTRWTTSQVTRRKWRKKRRAWRQPEEQVRVITYTICTGFLVAQLNYSFLEGADEDEDVSAMTPTTVRHASNADISGLREPLYGELKVKWLSPEVPAVTVEVKSNRDAHIRSAAAADSDADATNGTDAKSDVADVDDAGVAGIEGGGDPERC